MLQKIQILDGFSSRTVVALEENHNVFSEQREQKSMSISPIQLCNGVNGLLADSKSITKLFESELENARNVVPTAVFKSSVADSCVFHDCNKYKTTLIVLISCSCISILIHCFLFLSVLMQQPKYLSCPLLFSKDTSGALP